MWTVYIYIPLAHTHKKHTCTYIHMQKHTHTHTLTHTVVVGPLCAIGRAAQPSLVADRHVSLLSQFL